MRNLVVAIGREFGSGGKEIGQKLADRLNIKCYDSELLSIAAKNSGFCEEISTIIRFLSENFTLSPGIYTHNLIPVVIKTRKVRNFLNISVTLRMTISQAKLGLFGKLQQ